MKNETIPENPKAKGLLKASQELDYLKISKEEQLIYDKHEKDRHHEASIYESTYAIGELMGKKKNSIEIAKNLLDILDVETIALKTGLSIEEVANLTKPRS